jgi:hypothetical protein
MKAPPGFSEGTVVQAADQVRPVHTPLHGLHSLAADENGDLILAITIDCLVI